MKTLVFKENSWHHYLANFGMRRVHGRHTDICEYTRSVIKGLLLCILAYTMLAGVISLYAYTIYNWIMWALVGMELDKITTVVTGVTAICAGAIGVAVGWTYASERTSDVCDAITPNFVRVAYSSWKDKFCARVEFK